MLCPQKLLCRNITDVTWRQKRVTPGVLRFAVLGEGSPRTARELKTQKMRCKMWRLLSAGFGTLSWHEQQAIKCACLTDADFTYLLIYNHIYFYFVYIYIYLCLFTSPLSQWNVNLLLGLLVIAVWLTVLLCSVLRWCLVLHFSNWFGFLIFCYLLCHLSKIV